MGRTHRDQFIGSTSRGKRQVSKLHRGVAPISLGKLLAALGDVRAARSVHEALHLANEAARLHGRERARQGAGERSA